MLLPGTFNQKHSKGRAPSQPIILRGVQFINMSALASNATRLGGRVATRSTAGRVVLPARSVAASKRGRSVHIVTKAVLGGGDGG